MLRSPLLKYITLLAIILLGCSPQNNGLVSKIYNNTTAHYNAYFIAKTKLAEVEEAIDKSNQNNFNVILNIFSTIDSSTVKSQHAELEDVIKKASIAIQRHPNSKWVDDCFILIGKARYYLADFANAIATFKYVNTKSPARACRSWR